MKIERIYLDLDGVIADFNRGALALWGRTPVEAARINKPGDYEGIYGVVHATEEEFWARINAVGAPFWEELYTVQNDVDLFDACSLLAPAVILTSPSKEPSCVAGKLTWLQNRYGRGFRHYVFCPALQKQQLAGPGRLLIDDRDDNCQRWREAGGVAILYPQQWNSRHAEAATTPGNVAKMVMMEIGDVKAGRSCKPDILLPGNVAPKESTMVPRHASAGQKDRGLRFDLIPAYPTTEEALVYTLGSRKYADRNWEKGYPWSSSIAAIKRHLTKFEAGEDRDPDGFHHAAAIVFHAKALMQFGKTHPELDDRSKGGVDEIAGLMKAHVIKEAGRATAD